MEIITAALIVALAYVYAPILRVHAARRLHMQMPEGAVAPGAGPVVVPPVVLPAKIEQFCAAESEPWAQAEARRVAQELYAQFNDWDRVFVEMQKVA